MTIEDVKAMPDDFISADIVAKIIGANPQAIRLAARNEPWRLGFPSTAYGKKVTFPRKPFIQFVESGRDWFLSKEMMVDKLAEKLANEIKTPLPV